MSGWVMRDVAREDGQFITQVLLPRREYVHDGKVCDGIAISFTSVEGHVDAEVLATSGGQVVSPEPLVPYLERDDLLLRAARAIGEGVPGER